MKRAEDMAAARGYSHMAVISGIGTRNYYRKLGYEACVRNGAVGGFMVKSLRTNPFALARYALLAAIPVLLAALACALDDLLPGPPLRSSLGSWR